MRERERALKGSQKSKEPASTMRTTMGYLLSAADYHGQTMRVSQTRSVTLFRRQVIVCGGMCACTRACLCICVWHNACVRLGRRQDSAFNMPTTNSSCERLRSRKLSLSLRARQPRAICDGNFTVTKSIPVAHFLCTHS